MAIPPPSARRVLIRTTTREFFRTQEIADEYAQRSGAVWSGALVHYDGESKRYFLASHKCPGGRCRAVKIRAVDLTRAPAPQPTQRTNRQPLGRTGERIHREQQARSFATLPQRKLDRIEAFLAQRGFAGARADEARGTLYRALGVSETEPARNLKQTFKPMLDDLFGKSAASSKRVGGNFRAATELELDAEIEDAAATLGL